MTRTATLTRNTGAIPLTSLIPLIWREDEGCSRLVPLFFPHAKHPERESRIITLKELSEHNTRTDCWFAIHGRVYNATAYVARHPGGWLPMQAMAGKESSDSFEAYHPARVHESLLPSMFVGNLEHPTGSPSAFLLKMREVRQTLLRENRYQTDLGFYVKKGVWISFLFVVAIVLSLQPDYELLGAAVLGLFFQQYAFVAHDVGHNAVSHRRHTEFFRGVLASCLMGISLGWWKRSHNVHHTVCNSVEKDPDIQHLPLFAVNEKITRSHFQSTFHNKFFCLDFPAKLLLPYQHVLFYPVMMMARLNLHFQSFKFLMFDDYAEYRYWEMASMIVYLSWVALLGMHLQHPLLWFAISNVVTGILHVQICLSHFPMPVFLEEENVEWDWYSLQLDTTMNVACNENMDWFHGGLQFQVEHHFFPRLPRHELRYARKLVRESLEALDQLDRYHELSFLDGNILMMKNLRDSGVEAQKRGGGLFNPLIYNGMNLIG